MFSSSLFICIVCLSVMLSCAAPLIGSDSDTKIDNCGEIGDCILRPRPMNCTEICGCDMLYYFNETTNACELNKDYLKEQVKEKFDTQEKIRSNAEKVFGGIIISVILFVTCASICLVSACIYCCHINYTDHKLRSDVNALANKLNRDGKLQKKPKKVPTAPMAESCNVVVEDAVGSKNVKMVDASLMDFLITTICVLLIMSLICCLCCLCMKFSDLRMKSYIAEMAKRRGVMVDLDKLDPKRPCQSPLANENCTIFVPDVAIIL